jgi:hypothetical protein
MYLLSCSCDRAMRTRSFKAHARSSRCNYPFTTPVTSHPFGSRSNRPAGRSWCGSRLEVCFLGCVWNALSRVHGLKTRARMLYHTWMHTQMRAYTDTHAELDIHACTHTCADVHAAEYDQVPCVYPPAACPVTCAHLAIFANLPWTAYEHTSAMRDALCVYTSTAQTGAHKHTAPVVELLRCTEDCTRVYKRCTLSGR